ncbi:MAG: argininosuccinate lyase, partial [Acidimicrobiia bacterium]
LHTGRSRNDQVATDLRLFTKRELAVVIERILDLQQVLLDRAIEAGEAAAPGYTHLQRAQPVLLAHHLLAHGWAFARDVDRLLATRARLDVSPLGAGALAGSSLPLDPAATAADLGFAAAFDNSLDAVSDRDYVAEALFDLALVGVHLSRLAEEVILWSTDEFGFLRLDDAWATGSSMLPQKKNPDVAELARGKTGRLIGNLTGLLATLKALPLAYNRDLQEDKEPLFDSLDTVVLALGAMSGLLAASTFRLEALAAAADAPTNAATDLAEWLVARGVPFRDAHAIVGALVRRSLDEQLPLAELVEASPDLGPEAVFLVASGVAVSRRTTAGGGGPDPVRAQLVAFTDRLATDRARS